MDHFFGVRDGVWSFQDSRVCISVAMSPKLVMLPGRDTSLWEDDTDRGAFFVTAELEEIMTVIPWKTSLDSESFGSSTEWIGYNGDELYVFPDLEAALQRRKHRHGCIGMTVHTIRHPKTLRNEFTVFVFYVLEPVPVLSRRDPISGICVCVSSGLASRRI